jgi:MoxR-like ATPase
MEVIMKSVSETISALKKQNDFMAKYLIEKELQMELLNLSIMTGKNMIEISSPGTGKTFMAEMKSKFFQFKTFYTAYDNMTRKEDIFGSIDITKLKNGDYELKYQNFLPGSPFGIHDEIGRGGMVRNALLPIVHEGTFQSNGDTLHREKVADLALSNTELLDENMEALNDRFPIKCFSRGISTWENKVKMMKNRKAMKNIIFPKELCVTLEEILAVQEYIQNEVEKDDFFTDEMYEIYGQIQQAISTDVKVEITDRSTCVGHDVMIAYAIINGKSKVDLDCFEILKYCIVSEKKYFKDICKIINKFSNMELDLITTNVDDVVINHSDWKKATENHQTVDHRKIADRIKIVKHALDSMQVSDRNKVAFEQAKLIVVERYKEILKYAMQQIQRV